MTNSDKFFKKIRAMMKDDPLLKAIQSEPPEELTARLERLGIIENGKISESYKKKFKGSRAPIRTRARKSLQVAKSEKA